MGFGEPGALGKRCPRRRFDAGGPLKGGLGGARLRLWPHSEGRACSRLTTEASRRCSPGGGRPRDGWVGALGKASVEVGTPEAGWWGKRFGRKAARMRLVFEGRSRRLVGRPTRVATVPQPGRAAHGGAVRRRRLGLPRPAVVPLHRQVAGADLGVL